MDKPSQMVISTTLRGLDRCPHCGIAAPEMLLMWKSDCITPPGEHYGHNWATFRCTTCYNLLLAKSIKGNQGTTIIDKIYPAPRTIPDELPELAIRFLK